MKRYVDMNDIVLSVRWAVLGVFLLAVSACVTAPDVTTHVENVAATSEWEQISAQGSNRSVFADVDKPVVVRWWKTFNDPVLDELVEAALSQNLDIRKAQARLREARSVTRQIRSVLWPSVNASGSYTWTEQSVNSPNGPSSLIQAGFLDRELEFWGADLTAQWDVDLFGSNRFGAVSAQARSEASEAAFHGVRLATIAQVASGYAEFNGINRRLNIVQDNVAIQSSSLDVLKKLYAIGLENRLNVDRAAGQLAANRASVPGLFAQRKQALYKLALLTDMDVGDVEDEMEAAAALDAERVIPAIGVKSELLTRRPDVAAAQFQLYSASADVGQAKADLMPKLVIGATSGFGSGSVSNLFEEASRALAFAPNISVPVFNRGRLKAAREAAKARFDYALAHFEQTVTAAFIDTETRLLNLNAARDSAVLLNEAASNNRAAADRAQKLYDRGLLTYIELLDARRQQLRAEDAAVQGATGLELALVQLYVSLGGGWQLDETGTAAR
ncbi:MAG: efflux transporter outer membrane subunit [Gammaproteobacteria bacterium]